MLTLLDALSVAGDRAGQNDDAFGVAAGAAWVIDGATDLHDAPLSPRASDAAWIAETLNAWLTTRSGGAGEQAAALVRAASEAARSAFAAFADPATTARWQLPVAAMLLARETGDGLEIADLGDCRAFTGGEAHGGRARGKDEERQDAAAHAVGAGGARYRSDAARALLRAQRAAQNAAYGVFGIEPACAEFVRVRRIALPRGGHVLLATDGFAALVDVYEAYDAATLLEAARTRGLTALAAELRAIESADGDGARHPRWKRSDDATAVLLRRD